MCVCVFVLVCNRVQLLTAGSFQTQRLLCKCVVHQSPAGEFPNCSVFVMRDLVSELRERLFLSL